MWFSINLFFFFLEPWGSGESSGEMCANSNAHECGEESMSRRYESSCDVQSKRRSLSLSLAGARAPLRGSIMHFFGPSPDVVFKYLYLLYLRLRGGRGERAQSKPTMPNQNVSVALHVAKFLQAFNTFWPFQLLPKGSPNFELPSSLLFSFYNYKQTQISTASASAFPIFRKSLPPPPPEIFSSMDVCVKEKDSKPKNVYHIEKNVYHILDMIRRPLFGNSHVKKMTRIR